MNNNILLDRGIILSSGEISKDIMSHCSTISTRKVAAIASKLAHPVEIFA